MMDLIDASQIPWREPWMPLSAELAQRTEAELRRELCAEHPLSGRPVLAVGCRQDRDDFLFYVGASAPQLVVVHLTYKVESLPDFPDTVFFDSLADWIERCLLPEAGEFAFDPTA